MRMQRRIVNTLSHRLAQRELVFNYKRRQKVESGSLLRCQMIIRIFVCILHRAVDDVKTRVRIEVSKTAVIDPSVHIAVIG